MTLPRVHLAGLTSVDGDPAPWCGTRPQTRAPVVSALHQNVTCSLCRKEVRRREQSAAVDRAAADAAAQGTLELDTPRLTHPSNGATIVSLDAYRAARRR